MREKIINHIITGLGLGFVITTASLWIFGLYEATGMEVMREFTTWLVASVLYGLISLIYDSDIPMPLTIALHFTGCAATTFAACFVAGIMEFMKWYEWFKYVLPYFVIVYIIVSIIIQLTVCWETKKINKKMKELNK